MIIRKSQQFSLKKTGKKCRLNGDVFFGNDAVEQAKHFDETVGIDGIILTKFEE